ncbi:MAG: hypothetical protein V7K71_16030 [Nostoc sp.]|uniref:hypothetical protein n=1 Tax=Nostoc sp. TaxID=1180 RepID=UPI002FF44145
MDIQATLTLTIQAVIMSFVALMVFDFIDGLWVVPLPPIGWEPSVIEQPTVSATSPQPTPRAIAFERIPDPWTLELHQRKNALVEVGACAGKQGRNLQ